MKRFLVSLICIGMVFSSTGCGKEKNIQPTATQPEIKTEEPKKTEPVKEEPSLEGMAINPLTGLYIDEDAAKKRPFAVMINNLHKALPQSGIGQADLYYETLAEGEITRIVAVFQNFDAEKIGPVRSARDYFTYFALDNDAFFIHHGGSETGYGAIRSCGLDSIDGMTDGAFWRDQARLNTPGMYEHSSYTDAQDLMESVEAKGYRTERNVEPMFTFYDEDTALGGAALNATDVVIPFSSYQVSEFVYDEDTRLYTRIQSGEEQIDDLTGEAITVKNVILQQTEISIIPGDDAGRRNVDLVGSGYGVFITNGKARNITWEKADYSTQTKWYDEKGKELKMNTGKTWICVYPSNKTYTLE
ncbi:MAG: DUF3048 domain-containing protein [Anaerotignaceae bacterium]